MKFDKEFKVLKKKWKRLCKIIFEEDEVEVLCLKIGDWKVLDDELDMIVLRFIWLMNVSWVRLVLISCVFF